MLALWIRAQNKLHGLLHREDGQGMVEYGLIIALVAIGLITVLTTMRGQLTSTFSCISQNLTAAISGQPQPQC